MFKKQWLILSLALLFSGTGFGAEKREEGEPRCCVPKIIDNYETLKELGITRAKSTRPPEYLGPRNNLAIQFPMRTRLYGDAKRAGRKYVAKCDGTCAASKADINRYRCMTCGTRFFHVYELVSHLECHG